MDLLRAFLNLIPIRKKFSDNHPAEYQIDDVYWVDGVGTVVSGTCTAGNSFDYRFQIHICRFFLLQGSFKVR